MYSYDTGDSKTDKNSIIMRDVTEFLEEKFNNAIAESAESSRYIDGLPLSMRNNLDSIADLAENARGVLAVTVTSLVYKALNPQQDIRCHQTSIPGGYSGRTFDTHYITPFLREKAFPNMSTTGWMTRSLEQKHPYDFNYPGAIQPDKIKRVFLSLIDQIETSLVPMDIAIEYLFTKLIQLRDQKKIELATPKNLSINSIMEALTKHFSRKYKYSGASRLPVLAFYAVYQALSAEVKRYEGKRLLTLEKHNSADSRSGRLGDIDVVDGMGNHFEAVEIKYDIPINKEIVEIVKEKILPSAASRYYILSTKGIKKGDEDVISTIIHQVKNTHGCQIVINGIIPSLKYYLRLLDDTSVFIQNYAKLMTNDETIKFEHKEAWNKIIADL